MELASESNPSVLNYKYKGTLEGILYLVKQSFCVDNSPMTVHHPGPRVTAQWGPDVPGDRDTWKEKLLLASHLNYKCFLETSSVDMLIHLLPYTSTPT